MDHTFEGYKRRDWVIAAVLTLCILFIAGMQVTNGMPDFWAGDYAAYISVGKSIAEGTFEEQTVKNYIMHPSTLPAEANEEGLVYVWGYPLLLSLIYRLVGLDLVNYSTIICYKLPSLIAYAITAGILYLFYRRFLSSGVSVFLTLIFSASADLLTQINYMYSDIVFLCASVVTLWLAECFFDSFSKEENRRKIVFWAVSLGVSFWLTYEIRLNGNTLIYITAAAHVIRMIQQKKKLRMDKMLPHILPYLTFCLLKIVSEAILAPATPNTSDIGNLATESIFNNISYYFGLTRDYLNNLVGMKVWIPLVVFLVIGMVREGLKLRNIHLTGLLVGTYAVLLLLPYTQGLRYLANILPLLLLYIAHGAGWIINWIFRRIQGKGQIWKNFLAGISMACLLLVYFPVINAGVANIRNDRQVKDTDVYSQEAIDLYRFIQNNTSEDAIIAFYKPRILSLNTGRLCIRPNKNGHVLEEADYYLYSSIVHNPTDLQLVEEAPLGLVYSSPNFELYMVRKN